MGRGCTPSTTSSGYDFAIHNAAQNLVAAARGPEVFPNRESKAFISVMKGCGNNLAWAAAFMQALDGSQVLWMLAHLSMAQNSHAALQKWKSAHADDHKLTGHMVLASDFVARHANIVANTFPPLSSEIRLVSDGSAWQRPLQTTILVQASGPPEGRLQTWSIRSSLGVAAVPLFARRRRS